MLRWTPDRWPRTTTGSGYCRQQHSPIEYMLFIARSLELQALPYALNRPPRAAASFNKRGAGKGGFAALWRAGRAWPALPDRER